MARLWPSTPRHGVARALHVAFRHISRYRERMSQKMLSSRASFCAIEADQPMLCPRETFAIRRSGPFPLNPRHAHISGEGASEHCTFNLTSFFESKLRKSDEVSSSRLDHLICDQRIRRVPLQCAPFAASLPNKRSLLRKARNFSLHFS